ncbi:MAG: hypothetical protein A2Y18_05725 [Clostridiales bacterium GWD2_32_19]|nr:MAG: hypothetical protein A2Y18_05725 [Clostridiales bacterium GWD2_32_19]
MGKISNIITMLELLKNGKKYSIKDLAGRLEVTDRMVRIYKDELEKAGIYIDSIKGPYGGYVLNQKVALPAVGFSKYDIQLLKSMYAMLEKNKEFILKHELLNLIDKIDGEYKGSKKKVDGIPNIVEERDEKYREIETRKYNAIARAIKENQKMLINFLSASHGMKERIVHPCDLFSYNDSWYLAAFCELRNEIRHFRIIRIIEYKVLDQKYTENLIK